MLGRVVLRDWIPEPCARLSDFEHGLNPLMAWRRPTTDFLFPHHGEQITILAEKHYRLVPQSEVSPEDLLAYRNRPLRD